MFENKHIKEAYSGTGDMFHTHSIQNKLRDNGHVWDALIYLHESD